MPVHYMSCQFPLLVTAHQDRYIHIWNLNQNFQSNNFDPMDVIESPLRFATTALCCFGDGRGFAIGSIEGRCSIQNYDFARNNLGKDGNSDFCFKCHRYEHKPQNGQGQVFAVNSISFNKQWNTFATFVQDGTFTTWNKDTKTKYTTIPA